MAVVNPTVTHIGIKDGSTFKAVWPSLTTTDTSGAPLSLASVEQIDKSVQVNGTFGAGGAITIQGSNDGTNFYPLTDPQGNPISITAAGIEQVTEICEYVKPVLTGGDATTNLTITMIARRNNPLRT